MGKLTDAVRSNNLKEVQSLLDGEYKNSKLINEAPYNEHFPLYWATYYGYVDIIQVLLNAGADVNQAKDGCTPLYAATCCNRTAAIEMLIKAGADVNQADRNGYTLLYTAIQKGHLATIEALIKAGADVNLASKDGYTPLSAAVLYKHTAAIEALLNGGADISIKTIDGSTPLDIAKKAGYTVIVRLLDKHIFKLIEAITNNNLNEVQRLLEGEYKNTRLINEERGTYDGLTPLHKAAEKGFVDIIQALIKAGADVNLADKDGYTPLCVATYYNHTAAIEALLNGGADISIKTIDGRTPLDIAKKNGHTVIIRLLEKNKPENQFLLGEKNLYGTDGVVQNDKEAVVWFRKAAKQGHSGAQYMLGWFYENGRGVSKNIQQAMMWYQQATSRQHLQAGQAFQRLQQLKTPRKTSHQHLQARRAFQRLQQLKTPIIQLPEAPREARQNNENVVFSFALKYNELSIGKELGRGSFGIVYQGTWKKYTEVAIKQLILSKPSPDALAEFQQEMNLMNNLRCPQIVQLYGVYTGSTYGIVMEYMPNGSLYSVLHSNKPLAWDVRYSIAVDITKGVAFLHSENILHRDLKSLNVLLDKYMNAKLTDFGLAKIKTETTSTTSSNNTQVAGTLLWMAPELFKRKAQCTQQSDIYSLGMTLWELASRKKPFEDAQNPQIASTWVIQGQREDIPTDTPSKMNKLITICWDAEASKRPTADQAVQQLLPAEELKQEESSNFSYRSNFDSALR